MDNRQLSLLQAKPDFPKIEATSRSPVTIEDCIPWLRSNNLTWDGTTFAATPGTDGDPLSRSEWLRISVPCQRAGKLTNSDVKKITERYATTQPTGGNPLAPNLQTKIWDDYRNAKSKVRTVDARRLRPDAMAFYRFFHCHPHGEWGIYVLVDKLLAYCDILSRSFTAKLSAFNDETLVGMVLFEVFHHEFFHHLVESTATTIEIVLATVGEPMPVYRLYRQSCANPGPNQHDHAPLEEALANAYAYNSLSFLSRSKLGYKDVLIELYQALLEKYWTTEPEGYKYAGAYTGGRYISGGAQLLATMLPCGNQDPSSLVLLAKAVMPGGHTAFVHKPDIPTYLVGTVENLDRFYTLVPAPNETYTNLFWPRDTSALDLYLQKRRQEEKAQAKANRQAVSRRRV